MDITIAHSVLPKTVFTELHINTFGFRTSIHALCVIYPGRFSSVVSLIWPTVIFFKFFLMDKISQIQINILTNEVVGVSIYDQLPDVHKKTFDGKEKIQCNFESCFGFIACCKRSLWNLLPRHTEIRSGWQRIAILALHWKWKNPKKCFLYPVDLWIKTDH